MDGRSVESPAAERRASRSGDAADADPTRRRGLLASGSVIGALLASSCCILPLVLFSLGIGGAWMSNLTALEPYQPYFLGITLVMLGAGFYSVYARPGRACSTHGYCGTALADRVIKIALWGATGLAALALAWPYLVPRLLG